MVENEDGKEEETHGLSMVSALYLITSDANANNMLLLVIFYFIMYFITNRLQSFSAPLN